MRAPGAAARASASSTINPGAAARRQRELEVQRLKTLIRSAVVAVSDQNSACPGGPRPRLTLNNSVELQALGATPRTLSIQPEFAGPEGWACDPGGQHLLQSAAHALMAASAWAHDNPPLAPQLTIYPSSPDDLKRLQNGLAKVMSAYGLPLKP